MQHLVKDLKERDAVVAELERRLAERDRPALDLRTTSKAYIEAGLDGGASARVHVAAAQDVSPTCFFRRSAAPEEGRA